MEYVNPKFTQLTGYSFDEAIGKNPRILKSGMVPDVTYRDLWQTVLCGGKWRGEFANKKKSGEVYWESASIVPIRGSSGAITHFLAVKEDITERKRGEIALREARQCCDSSSSTAGRHCHARPGDAYLVVSQRWMTDFRLGDQDIQGLSHYEVFPEIPERWKEIHRRCLAGEVETCPEDPFTRRDGLVDWLRWEIRPWRRIDDSIGGIIIFSEHITERKQAEEALRESEARYRAFIEHSREGVWRVELEQPIPISLPAEEILERLMQYGYLAECNLAHAHNLGFSTISEIVGKPLRDLVPSADEERSSSFRAEARSGWHNRGISCSKSRQIGQPPALCQDEISIISNGMLVRAWGITRDVTDPRHSVVRIEDFRAEAGQVMFFPGRPEVSSCSSSDLRCERLTNSVRQTFPPASNATKNARQWLRSKCRLLPPSFHTPTKPCPRQVSPTNRPAPPRAASRGTHRPAWQSPRPAWSVW